MDKLEVNGYMLSIECIPEGEPCAGMYRVKAEPIHPYGYLFCAYETHGHAEEVIRNCAEGFNDQVYRVNFNPDNAKISYEDFQEFKRTRKMPKT